MALLTDPEFWIRLLGIGVVNYVETPVGMPHERVAVKVAADRVDLIVGTQSSGQGHETSFRQVMADKLGVTPEAINFVGGDTATLASGGGTHSDRSMRLAGALMVETSQTDVEEYGIRSTTSGNSSPGASVMVRSGK